MRRWRYLLLFSIVSMIALAIVEFGREGIKPGSFIQLDLSGSYREAPPGDLVSRLLLDRPTTFLDLLELLRQIRDDSRIGGVVVRVSSLSVGWAKAQEIRAALIELRDAGKQVVGMLEQESGGATMEYYIASATKPLYVTPSATAALNGLAAQVFFLGGVWEKLDIQMNVEKIREYKTMGDMVAYKEMTPAHREMTNSLLDSMTAQIVGDIASARGLSEEEVRSWIDRAPSTGSELEAAKLCDGVKHIQDLEADLSPEVPFIEAKKYTPQNQSAVHLAGMRQRIAVIYAAGNIVTGDGGGAPANEAVGSDTLSRALDEAQEADDIKAIILRVDSPGGSALASDLIWRATQSARKRKPLVVSMSDVAASGGYYIAAGADRIVAAPATLTGSIGVVSMRPYVRELLQKLGINSETILRGKMADLNDITRPLDAERRRHLLHEMEHVYDVFVSRVADGRKLTSERVNDIGRGRVWTGAQAKEVGLVDELGGFRVAEASAKELAGIAADEPVDFEFYPRPGKVFGSLNDLVASSTQVKLPHLVQIVSDALLLPFEEQSVLTLMPLRIELH